MINKYNKMISEVLVSTVILSNMPTYLFVNEYVEKTSNNFLIKNINNTQNNTEVNILDTDFKGCINLALGRNLLSESPITISDLESITQLNGANKEIKSIEGIQYMTNLTYLNLSNTKILDITPLLNLKKLTTLDISNTLVNNFNKLGEIISLNELYLNNVSLSNTSFINKLQNLKSLYLNKSTILEQLSLENMNNLEMVSLRKQAGKLGILKFHIANGFARCSNAEMKACVF